MNTILFDQGSAKSDNASEDASSDGSSKDQQMDMESQESFDDDAEQVFQGHTDSVLAVAWNKKQIHQVASGGQDEKAFIFEVGQDTAEGHHTKELKTHTDSIIDLKFSRNGNYLATAGMDGQVVVWQTDTGQVYAKLQETNEAITWVDWHPLGDILLVGSEDYTIWMWNAERKMIMQTFLGHGDIVICGGFTPDGRLVVTGGDDTTLRVWDPKQGISLHVFQNNPWHAAGITTIKCTNDNHNIVSGGIDGSIKLTNLEKGKFLANFGEITSNAHTDSVEAIDQSNIMDNLIVSGGMDGQVKVWDLRLAQPQATMPRVTCSHVQGVSRVMCHPSKPQFFTSCVDGGVRQWDIRQGQVVQEQHGHSQAIQDIDVNPEGSMVLTGGDDGYARIFVFL